MESELSEENGALEVEATTEKAKTISAIDRTTVHQICSGQVVLNLATAVKELVENSLDAGATSVEVRLKDHGATLIEVSDNGSGVEESNFQGLTLKHHTSKLREFQDLVGVQTFGFRGEALSSLCALAKVSISTRHVSSQLGSTIDYDHNGKIVEVRKGARGLGTTVILRDIFSTMPVRIKEFHRNIKKEFSRLCQVLNSYCLVSTGVRIQCVNTTGKGKRTVVLSTKGEHSVKENITSIFGSKQASSLREIEQADLSQEDLADIGFKHAANLPDVKLQGYISNCNYGEGRGATDRQFYYINSRPCDPTKISKLVNEVFHFYNRNQYPFVYLNIVTQRTTVDVNITPDKRQVFLQNERYLCRLIKKSLDNMFKETPRDMPINIKGLDMKVGEKENKEEEDHKETLNISSLKRKLSSLKSSSPDQEAPSKPVRKQPKMDFFVTKVSREDSMLNNAREHELEIREPVVNEMGDTLPVKATLNPSDKTDIDKEKMPSRNVKANINGFTLQFDDMESLSQSQGNKTPNDSVETSGVRIVFDDLESLSQSQSKKESGAQLESNEVKITFDDLESLSQTKSVDGPEVKVESNGVKITFDDLESLSQSQSEESPEVKVESNGVKITFDDLESLSQKQPGKSSNSRIESNGVRIEFDDLESLSQSQSSSENLNSDKNDIQDEINPKMDQHSNSINRGGLKISFDNFHSLSQQSNSQEINEKGEVTQTQDVNDDKNEETSESQVMEDDSTPGKKSVKKKEINFSMESLKQSLEKIKLDEEKEVSLKFSAKICPQDNQTAEKELMRQISKTDFARMNIFGQFNLGFIIAGLDNDLFIIDQHATDEKYNFERLQQTTVINSQPMVTPQPLELTAVNENVLMDNLHVFNKNGFKFQIDEDAPATQRVRLSHLPISKNWSFGKQDIDELIFIISESSTDTVLRPSRVRAMFASRACRSSVMIGKSLSQGEMRRLIDHMGEIEQPWNCPHGRPTIRHLVNTDLV